MELKETVKDSGHELRDHNTRIAVLESELHLGRRKVAFLEGELQREDQ